MKDTRSGFMNWIFTGTLLFALVLGSLIPATAAPSQTQYAGYDVSESRLIIRAIQQEGTPQRVLPPVDLSRAPKTATITVNYQGTWDAPAQAAFSYAASIWETLINSSAPLVVDAYWSDLGATSGILGGAYGETVRWASDTGPFEKDLWYPAALANAMANTDILTSNAEIVAQFNNARSDWYFGTNGNPGGGEYDFVSVVLHELGHGLGFFGSMAVDDGVLANGKECGVGASTGEGCWGWNSTGRPLVYSPTVFDRFAENNLGQSLLNTGLFPNPSTALGNQLLGGNVFFDGPNANVGNGGSPPELYAPAGWLNGSSFSHLDEDVYAAGNPNALMTPYLANGEANHNPGQITLGIFEDIGWNTALNTAPVIDGLPSQVLLVNTTKDNAIDLWAYTSDIQDADSNLTFVLDTPLPNANAGVSIDSNRYIDINPNTDWTGSTTVIVQVTDTDTLTDTDTFVVLVASDFVYVPLIQRE